MGQASAKVKSISDAAAVLIKATSKTNLLFLFIQRSMLPNN
jgi:hypothetical protein